MEVNKMNKKGFILPIFLIIGMLLSIYLILFGIGFGAAIKTNNYYNNNCPQESQGYSHSALYEDEDYSLDCFYDNEGNLEERRSAFVRGLFAPLNLLNGNPCGAGFGNKKDSEGRCTIIPLWVKLP